ncbi:MAG: restriction endonuclease subunit S [Gallionella sp.]|nr:restriction endonuclease subunit S [Gallionella sp.]
MKLAIKTTALGNVVELIMGQAPSSKDCNFDGRGTPFVKVGEFRETRPEIREWTTNPLRMARLTDVLLCVVGATCGKINLGEECAIGRSVAAIRPRVEKLDQLYLYYFMMTLVESLRSGSVGAAQTVISKDMIETVQIPNVPLPEQQRIVAILDAAFDGIATAKATAEQNLQNARALFESQLQSVFTLHGEGWVEKKLSDVCAITSTLVDPRKEEFLDLTHVGAGNIESQTGVFVELKTAREEGLISGKFLFDESMVLYSKIRPYLMKVARPHFNGLCSADMYPLAPLPNAITRDYLFYLLLSKSFTDYAIQGSARAGMPKVNREHLFEFRVWLPDVKKQAVLAAKLDALHEETQRLESLYQRKLAALDEMKKSLLHQAFSGAL